MLVQNGQEAVYQKQDDNDLYEEYFFKEVETEKVDAKTGTKTREKSSELHKREVLRHARTVIPQYKLIYIMT